MEFNYGIVDPNAASFLQLQHFLEEYEGLQCVSHDAEPRDALNSILKFKPDIVFVNLEERASEIFAMIRDIHQYLESIPVYIGMAQSRDHAYEAIKHQFFDYWVLPFSEFEIRKTLLKVGKRLPKPESAPVICLQSYKDYQFLNTNEILYLKADNNATDFILKDGSRVSAFKTLKSFEQQLPANFVRVHQSYILNRDYISRINYGKSRFTLKFGKAELPFSRGYRQNVDALKQALSLKSLSGDN
ncbi:LytTR family DNA-binding domain-containing protein [Robiginitalea sp. SC105]|uniref:LytR/AlgR family response regulator transcription factor n=1 Tax=Robiginitalea sp. SC105 TaxID=2762332 RepID=UPI00163A87A0|nr:LytTR family DNA-binding domain-containing protein [Robiginitalea sp. SC105]MBC2840735.1 response regulator transcription factor [Robiginitalea sp. SC105]